jgi:hypothetical protein
MTPFVKVLLNKYLPAKIEALEPLLSKQLYQSCKALDAAEKNPQFFLFNPKYWILASDPSWIEEAIVSENETARALIVAALPQAHADFFVSKGVTSLQKKPLTEPVKDFLLGWLFRRWNKEHTTVGDFPFLPKKSKELLGQSEFLALVNMDHRQLLSLIDLLAINDLIEEVRHIVDKRLLQALLEQLSGVQQRYLRLCLRQKTKSQPGGGFGLKEQLKNARNLSQALHKRGLLRLAQALSGADSDTVWYILHTLDIARAKAVIEHYQQEEIASVTNRCRQQVQHVFQFLKTDLVS